LICTRISKTKRLFYKKKEKKEERHTHTSRKNAEARTRKSEMKKIKNNETIAIDGKKKNTSCSFFFLNIYFSLKTPEWQEKCLRTA
jgi:hypothetical protein